MGWSEKAHGSPLLAALQAGGGLLACSPYSRNIHLRWYNVCWMKLAFCCFCCLLTAGRVWAGVDSSAEAFRVLKEGLEEADAWGDPDTKALLLLQGVQMNTHCGKAREDSTSMLQVSVNLILRTGFDLVPLDVVCVKCVCVFRRLWACCLDAPLCLNALKWLWLRLRCYLVSWEEQEVRLFTCSHRKCYSNRYHFCCIR